MNTDKKFVLEMVGIAAIVVSLLFVGVELRLARSVATSETYAASHDATRELQTLLADNYEVWLKGCIDEEMSQSEKFQFSRMFEVFQNYVFVTWRRVGTGITGNSPEQFSRAMARNLYRYPGLLKVWRESRASTNGSGEFAAEVNRLLDELIATPADRSFGVEFCGQIG